MAKEYIEREALREVVNNLRLGRHLNKDAALNLMERAMVNLPVADVVEVVRCKDCKYLRPEVDAYTQEVTGYWCCLIDIGSVEENHFCSYGERRDNNADD